MTRELRSIGHAAIAHGFHIYLPVESKNYVIASRLVCAECNEPWYMNLTECFLCSSVNPFLYRCNSCKNFSSITKASGRCDSCGKQGQLHKECPNPDCISNTDSALHDAVNNLGGVFEKYSGFGISMQYCLKCGSHFHLYQIRRIIVQTLSSVKVNKSDLIMDDPEVLQSYSYVLFRILENGKKAYAFLSLEEYNRAQESFELTEVYEDFGQAIGEIFGKDKD